MKQLSFPLCTTGSRGKRQPTHKAEWATVSVTLSVRFDVRLQWQGSILVTSLVDPSVVVVKAIQNGFPPATRAHQKGNFEEACSLANSWFQNKFMSVSNINATCHDDGHRRCWQSCLLCYCLCPGLHFAVCHTLCVAHRKSWLYSSRYIA